MMAKLIFVNLPVARCAEGQGRLHMAAVDGAIKEAADA